MTSRPRRVTLARYYRRRLRKLGLELKTLRAVITAPTGDFRKYTITHKHDGEIQLHDMHATFAIAIPAGMSFREYVAKRPWEVRL